MNSTLTSAELGRRKDAMVLKTIAFYSIFVILLFALVKIFMFKFLKSLGIENDTIILVAVIGLVIILAK